jgi:crotonobetainyl-CoA:carnitine CoA-transferase CaiB-like acyl-CoA transferase
VQTIAHPTIPALQSIGLPLLIGGVRPPLRRHPPVLGEHTREVLTELGFGPEQIAALGSRPDSTADGPRR